MPSQKTVGSVSQSIVNAGNDGIISPQSAGILTGALGQLVVSGASGHAAENIKASEVTLFTLALDKSSSIHDSGLEDAIREGQHTVLDGLKDAKGSDEILVAQWLFNEGRSLLHSYVPVSDAVRLDKTNYRAHGATSLYDTVLDAVAANIAYAHDLENGAFPTPTRSVFVVLTDGEDVGSHHRVSDVHKVVTDLVKSEKFIVGFVGVGDERRFRDIGKQMGFPDGCILVEKSMTAKGVRAALQMVSRSARLASQGAITPGASQNFFNP